ncbi:MAG TPA: MFS transporter [Bacteroidales bacterium]|jgi:maltose/moltooligosaccharide transporter|nr:MFS transporter [Bacteroidales bacterium]MDI9573234.1 MFS transporter [Bacteroidota bacterium]OQC58337.1 MAG: Major Facilitator Superfamily protein [Bacteroidetes bacterium ADurb.Bin012]MBP9512645.1 MFS transporter [Bacteroidales bacterium]MBP9589242.1 MFS transporter [Bacteroidales bacterium]
MSSLQAKQYSKPKLSFWQIWNMSVGFLGIQFGFALQNANASRILQTFGADVEHLSWFWIAAPLTGMIVQPIIGHYSDKTWCKLGRRRPYFLAGAILASLALVFMPNAELLTSVIPPMFIGAGILMILDASINVAMEPFRALVADMLPTEQRTLGFSIQTALIGIGAVIGSWLPYIFAEWLGISKTAPEGQVPDNVVFSFYVGAAVFISCVLWTVIRTKEYPPEQLRQFSDIPADEQTKGGFIEIFRDFAHIPRTMKQLGVVQFFSWFALFSMWVFTTPAVAVHIYGAAIDDRSSEIYQNAGNWVGICFGVYNAISALYAFIIPSIAGKIGRKLTHSLSLILGGIGLISIYFVPSPKWLLLPMVGIGIAWGSILSMPYSILAGSLPAQKMGVYMGIFNFFITIPQIINGIVGGPIVKRIYDSQAIYALVMAGICMLIASISVIFVDDKDDPVLLRKQKNVVFR